MAKDLNTTGRWLKRLTQGLADPQDRKELVVMLRDATDRGLIDSDALTMLEGVLEVGETLRGAAKREAREETGLTVEPKDLLGVYDRVLRDGEGRTLYHFVLIDFLCPRVSGEARAADDADEIGWFTPAEVDALALPEDTAQVIRQGFIRK